MHDFSHIINLKEQVIFESKILVLFIMSYQSDQPSGVLASCREKKIAVVSCMTPTFIIDVDADDFFHAL